MKLFLSWNRDTLKTVAMKTLCLKPGDTYAVLLEHHDVRRCFFFPRIIKGTCKFSNFTDPICCEIRLWCYSSDKNNKLIRKITTVWQYIISKHNKFVHKLNCVVKRISHILNEKIKLNDIIGHYISTCHPVGETFELSLQKSAVPIYFQ